jgi:hypothetical protein
MNLDQKIQAVTIVLLESIKRPLVPVHALSVMWAHFSKRRKQQYAPSVLLGNTKIVWGRVLVFCVQMDNSAKTQEVQLVKSVL